jgi:hypothetical protein
VLLVARNLSGPFMDKGHQPSIWLGAECDALYRPGTMTGGIEHLAAAQDELHRTLHLSRCNRRQGDVRPGSQGGAERATDKR